jgi:transposase
VRAEAERRPEVRLLMTHPGVGPVVGLAYVLTIGPVARFPRGKQVASYLGADSARAFFGRVASTVRAGGTYRTLGQFLRKWVQHGFVLFERHANATHLLSKFQ